MRLSQIKNTVERWQRVAFATSIEGERPHGNNLAMYPAPCALPSILCASRLIVLRVMRYSFITGFSL